MKFQNVLKLNALHGNEKMQQWIENRVIKIPESGCWIWALSNNKLGYADYGGSEFKNKFGTSKVHRLSYVCFNNALLEDQCVCHTCDTPLCVNPYHLFAASQKQNMGDAIRKNRHIAIKQRKLNNKQILEIRQSQDLGIALAKKFNVSPKTISFIKNNITYRNVSTFC